MRIAFKVGLILLPAFIFWGCQTEEVADLSGDVKTTEVMVRLAASSSQAEAEAAVRSLIVKAEMGETFPGSRYELYTFSDEDIAELAELHRYYQNGELLITLGRTFEAIMYIADHIPLPKMEFDTAMSMLAEETEAALADPEEPGNALLMAIASENESVPKTVPLYDENTVRSPVQTMLFAIWFHREFAGLSKLPDKGSSSDLAPSRQEEESSDCEAACYDQYILDVAECARKHRNDLPSYYNCVSNIADKNYDNCMEDCHDQGGS
jgi:hypothetical protein